MMRKVLMVSIVSLISAAGCQDCFESLRRVEVWKQHTFNAPAPTQWIGPGCPTDNPCPPVAEATCAAPIGEASCAAPTTVSMPVVADPPDAPVSTEVLDGVLKQP